MLPRLRPYTLVPCVLASTLLYPTWCHAQTRFLPETRANVLTGPEERKRNERLSNLRAELKKMRGTLDLKRSTSEAAELEQQAKQKESEIRALWGPTYDLLPEFTERWREIPKRLRLDRDRSKEPLQIEEADALVAELFFDTGVPEGNDEHQHIALYHIQLVLREGDVSDPVRQVLLRGLTDYHAAGGGYSSPWVMQKLACSLAAGALSEDVEALELAYALREQTLDWYQDLQFLERPSPGIDLMEQLFERHDMLTSLLGSQLDLSDGGALVELDEVLDKRLRKALQRMLQLLPKARRRAAMAAQLRRIALDDYRSVDINDAMLTLLLNFYRYLLADPLRGGAAPSVVQFIDRHLVELLEMSRNRPVNARIEHPNKQQPDSNPRASRKISRKRLRTVEHWEAWSTATAALRDRASNAAKRALRERAKTEPNDVVRAAIEAALKAVSAKSIRDKK